jgi:hypothetical protein
MTDPTPAEISAEPYEHQLPDGTISVPHESTLPALGKDRAAQAWDTRGTRGTAVELMRLALPPKEFRRLEALTDKEFFGLFNGWYEHCGLSAGEPDASTS